MVAPYIRRRLANTFGGPRRVNTVRAITELLQKPLFRYRALPQPLRFHKSQKKFRWLLGGNRSSKSTSLAHEAMYFATGSHPFRRVATPNTGWYCTVSWDDVGEIVWPKLEPLLLGFEYRVIWHNRGRGIPHQIQIGVPGGVSKIVLKSYEEGRGAFQGVGRRWIANDEQFPQDIYVEQITRISPQDPLDFFAGMTPILNQPWLEERLSIEVPESYDVFECPLDDNRESVGGFYPDAVIDAMIDEWPEESQATRRLGKWGSFVGAVYKAFSRAAHVLTEEEERRLVMRDGRMPVRSVGGIDWGGNNPFVFLWAAELGDGQWYVFDEYYWDYRAKGDRLIRRHAEEILSRSKKWGTSLARVWADHDRQDRMEIAAAGVPTANAMKTVETGIEVVRTLLKVRERTGRPRLQIAARCKNLIREMMTYRYGEGTDLRDPKEEPLKKSDHCVDNLRYILASEIRGRPSGEIIALPDSYRRAF